MRAELKASLRPGSPEEQALRGVDLAALPRHVAIMMDGNGRWAARRAQPRIFGHRRGIESVRDTVEAAALLGLEALTLYAFSRENWKRPRREVETLMSLLREFLRKEIDTLARQQVRFQAIGRLSDLDDVVRRDVEWARERTAENTGLAFNVALSYGSRAEILDAIESARRLGVDGRLDEAGLEELLYTAGLPRPDLVIRTSGEHRLSNFLLFQSPGAELWLTDELWPDFRRRHLHAAIAEFQRRRGLLRNPSADRA